MWRELKRRIASRAKEARKAEKGPAAPPDGVKQKVEAKPHEDDLNPNVRALMDVTYSSLISVLTLL